MMNRDLRIGEISDITGVSRDTLRYYEKEGLIKSSMRSTSGYRLYSSRDQEAIRFVLAAKKVGFSLDAIASLLSIKINRKAKSCKDLKDITTAKLTEVDEKIKELQKIRVALKKLHESCCGGPEKAQHCSILQALEAGDV